MDKNSDKNIVETLLYSFLPPRLLGGFKRNNGETTQKDDQSYELAMRTFRQRIASERESMGYQQHHLAPDFDYVRWKPHNKHRMHESPDEFVLTCQALAPYINSVAASSWEGLTERRWAGLTTPPPSVGLPPKSGSRSQFGSRDVLVVQQ